MINSFQKIKKKKKNIYLKSISNNGLDSAVAVCWVKKVGFL